MQWWQKKINQVGQSLLPSHNFSLMIVNVQFHQMVFWAGVVLMENVKNVNPLYTILSLRMQILSFILSLNKLKILIWKKVVPKLLRKDQKKKKRDPRVHNAPTFKEVTKKLMSIKWKYLSHMYQVSNDIYHCIGHKFWAQQMSLVQYFAWIIQRI